MSGLTQVVGVTRTPAQRLLALADRYALTAAVAIVVFLVAYDNGGFGESTRDTFGIVLWWILILCVGLGIWPLARTPAAAWATGGLLAAFGLWTLLSVVWAADAAGAYAEFTRVMLYVAVFAVTVAATRRDNAARWLDGLALAIVGVMILGLVSRFFPGTLEQAQIAQLLTAAQTRLSFPLGYWNGLAVLLALGIPLLLRVAVSAASLTSRAVALAPLPAFAGAIYLSSSRAGIATAAIGTATFVLLTAHRWRAAAAVAVAGVGSALVILALYDRNTLVNGPLDSSLAEKQGHSAALIVTGLCVLTCLLYGVGAKVFQGRFRSSPILGWSLTVAMVALVVAGLIAAHPVRRFEAFKNPNISLTGRSAIQEHLLSSSGNGRWQLWSSAIDEFASKPGTGRGAGSFQAWWLQHGSLQMYVQDAHSLYAEVLGELGVVGFLLLVGVFATGLVVAVARLLRADGDQRIVLAAAVSSFVTFGVAAGVDWMWELTIVPVVAVSCLAVGVGPGTALVARPRIAEPGEPPPRGRLGRYGVGVGVIVAGWLIICAIAIPLLGNARLDASQKAAARGDLPAAVDRALGARTIQPWAFEPYLQVALLEEQAGNYGTARRWIRRALARDASNWQLWFVKSRIEAELGAISAARKSLRHARVLNPHLLTPV